MEQSPGATIDQPGLRRLVVAGAVIMALSGCSAGNESEPAPGPADTATYVDTDAYKGELGRYDVVDTSAITTEIEAKVPYTELENTDPKTGEATYDFPVEESAAVLTISLGNNNRLVYTDTTPGLSENESKILAAVEANSPLLTASMAAGSLSSVHFRIYAPDLYDIADEPGEHPFYLPRDSTEGGKPNIYYFLPAKDRVDSTALQAMIGHEASHAAFGHSNDSVLTPEQHETYRNACETIRNSALAEVDTYNSAEYDLYQLWMSAPTKLKPVYEEVIKALENGTYGELPTHELALSNIKECYIQRPMEAVTKQARLKGVFDLYNEESGNKSVLDIAQNVQDEWSLAIMNYTIYRYLREAAWLPSSERNRFKGHPQDGLNEIVASTFNRLMHDPKAFGEDMSSVSTEESGAVIAILDQSTDILRKTCPGAHDLHQLIGQRREVFDAAFSR